MVCVTCYTSYTLWYVIHGYYIWNVIHATLYVDICDTRYAAATRCNKSNPEKREDRITEKDEKKLIAIAASAFEQNIQSFHVEQAGGQMLCRPCSASSDAVAADELAENKHKAKISSQKYLHIPDLMGEAKMLLLLDCKITTTCALEYTNVNTFRATR